VKPVFHYNGPSLKIAWTAMLVLLSGTSIFGAELKPAWQVEWAKTEQAAKKEGEVVLYGGQDYERIFGEFQKNYPEIKVTMVVGTGGPTLQRLLNERRAGRHLGDLLLGGMSTGYRLY
jgi:hypothetical protein